MKTLKSIALAASFMLGMVAATMFPGCQPPQPTTVEPQLPETENPAEEPAALPTDEPAETTDEPAEETTDEPAETTIDDEAQTGSDERPVIAAVDKSANPQIKPGDWSQWGGTSYRNNVPEATGIPTEWETGGFDRKTGEWNKEEAVNIKWVARVGSQTYGNPVVADGQVYIGTNNGAGYLRRYPYRDDLGCLLAFNETDGSFLWQDSSEKLPTGRVHDWPLQGICCAPMVQGERLWYVTSRGEIKCLDTKGFYDDEDDGPVTGTSARLFDLMKGEGDDDPFAAAVSALNEGSLTEVVRENFTQAGAELPDEVTVETVAEGKAWKVTPTIDGAQREINLKVAGPKLSVFKIVTPDDKEEADVIWVYDMMKEVGISQHNMCSCSVTALGDILFVNTSNGVDESHVNIPAPDAPSFMAMNKNTGEVYWTDKSPGLNILHGQWSSPTVAELGGVPQVLFGGGDGWVYSFRADEGTDGKPELLWKFDANPKTSKWILGGRGTRNNIIATPVICDGLVYVAVGQDPEHGEGVGHLWCIDPTRRGNVSPQLAMKVEGDGRTEIEHRRLQAVIEEDGEIAVDNPNTAAIWHYESFDQDGDGDISFEEQMHRSCGTVAIKNDFLYIADFSGLFHSLDAKTGKVHWTYDMLAAAWGSPLIVDGHVYIGDEDGDVCVFELGTMSNEPLVENYMENAVYSTPIVANGTLFISNKSHLFAIEEQGAE